MKAKDLRLGNYVLSNLPQTNHENDYYTVDLILLEIFDSVEVEPIQLTEEWLIKFGFEKDREVYNLGIPVFVKNNFRIWDNRDKVEYEKILGYSDSSDFKFIYSKNIQPYIKYVHQLQNLYFSLTGEELKINVGSD